MISNVERSCAAWHNSSAKRPVMRIPFSSMVDVSAVPPLPHAVKLFLGGLDFEMGRDDVARFASHFSGSWVSPADVVVFMSCGRSTGSAVCHLSSREAADTLIADNRRLLCEPGGMCVTQDVDEMKEHQRASSSKGHPVVIEAARPRRSRIVAAPLVLFVAPFWTS